MHSNIKQVDSRGSYREFGISGVDYSKMVEILGSPHVADDSDKVDVSWAV